MKWHATGRVFGALVLAHLSVEPAKAADVEVFAGFQGVRSLMNGAYDGSYTPARVGGIGDLFGTPDARSRARQILTLDGDSGRGFGLGLNVYPHRTFGFQLLLDRARADLSGASPPHTIDLVYDSISFPSTEPIVVRRSPWCDTPATAARITTSTLSLNGAARWKAGPRVRGTVSAGVSYFRARAEGVRVTAFGAWLGGHAVLFSDLFEMSLATEAAGTVGINVGADVSVGLGTHLALFADGRLFHAPTASALARLTAFTKEPLVSVDLARVERSLALRPVDLDPSSLRLLVGLKWRR